MHGHAPQVADCGIAWRHTNGALIVLSCVSKRPADLTSTPGNVWTLRTHLTLAMDLGYACLSWQGWGVRMRPAGTGPLTNVHERVICGCMLRHAWAASCLSGAATLTLTLTLRGASGPGNISRVCTHHATSHHIMPCSYRMRWADCLAFTRCMHGWNGQGPSPSLPSPKTSEGVLEACRCKAHAKAAFCLCVLGRTRAGQQHPCMHACVACPVGLPAHGQQAPTGNGMDVYMEGGGGLRAARCTGPVGAACRSSSEAQLLCNQPSLPQHALAQASSPPLQSSAC